MKNICRMVITAMIAVIALTFVGCNNSEALIDSESAESHAETTDAAETTSKTVKMPDLSRIKPAESENVTPEILPDGLPSFGYCAVGQVDTASGKVAVLGENGVVVTRLYDGMAPASGYVYAYETEGDYIAFTSVPMFPGFGSEYKDWVFGAFSSSKSIYYGAAYRCTNESVFFVYFGNYEWRVFKGIDAIKGESIVSKGGYLYAPDGETITFMMICGECGEFGKLKPATSEQSKIFDPEGKGWSNGDKIVKIATQ